MGQAPLIRADLHVCWSTTADKASAEALEDLCEAAFRVGALWNREAYGSLGRGSVEPSLQAFGDRLVVRPPL